MTDIKIWVVVVDGIPREAFTDRESAVRLATLWSYGKASYYSIPLTRSCDYPPIDSECNKQYCHCD